MRATIGTFGLALGTEETVSAGDGSAMDEGVGSSVGTGVGSSEEERISSSVGQGVGSCVGEGVGSAVGDSVGSGVCSAAADAEDAADRYASYAEGFRVSGDAVKAACSGFSACPEAEPGLEQATAAETSSRIAMATRRNDLMP